MYSNVRSTTEYRTSCELRMCEVLGRQTSSFVPCGVRLVLTFDGVIYFRLYICTRVHIDIFILWFFLAAATTEPHTMSMMAIRSRLVWSRCRDLNTTCWDWAPRREQLHRNHKYSGLLKSKNRCKRHQECDAETLLPQCLCK